MKKKNWKREKVRNNTLFVGTLCIEWERENCKFIVRWGEEEKTKLKEDKRIEKKWCYGK